MSLQYPMHADWHVLLRPIPLASPRPLAPPGAGPEDMPRNCASDSCSYFCNMGCKSGHKQSTDMTFLVRPAP